MRVRFSFSFNTEKGFAWSENGAVRSTRLAPIKVLRNWSLNYLFFTFIRTCKWSWARRKWKWLIWESIKIWIICVYFLLIYPARTAVPAIKPMHCDGVQFSLQNERSTNKITFFKSKYLMQYAYCKALADWVVFFTLIFFICWFIQNTIFNINSIDPVSIYLHICQIV